MTGSEESVSIGLKLQAAEFPEGFTLSVVEGLSVGEGLSRTGTGWRAGRGGSGASSLRLGEARRTALAPVPQTQIAIVSSTIHASSQSDRFLM
jgi:hypothetical protein